MSNINVTLSEKELATAISGILFSCSVNVISNTNSKYQFELLNLAKKLKDYKPDIKLEEIQFIKEENYEDEVSVKLYESFESNLEVTNFDNI